MAIRPYKREPIKFRVLKVFNERQLMESFDVVVVGAGPAGGHCARQLAKLGYRVLLTEQHKSFADNNFSSAGTPLKTLHQFDLPDSVVGSFWHNLAVITTQGEHQWRSDQRQGAVLDFAKLRAFLAGEVTANGGEVWLGHRYQHYFQDQGQTLVQFRERFHQQVVTVATQVLVDATGSARAILSPKNLSKTNFLQATGIEYLIEVDSNLYQKYSDQLTFLLGYKWMPKGYSWIFPMNANQLKVGVAWLNAKHQLINPQQSLKHYLDLLIQEFLKVSHYQILDVHGGILKYSKGFKDRYTEENVIAIGDAVSTVNFLGGEGIRHGMYSAQIASNYIHQYLQHQISSFAGYKKSLYQTFQPTWDLSAKIAEKVYLQKLDKIIDQQFDHLKTLTIDDMMDILFEYKLGKVKNIFLNYLRVQMQQFFNQIIDISKKY